VGTRFHAHRGKGSTWTPSAMPAHARFGARQRTWPDRGPHRANYAAQAERIAEFRTPPVLIDHLAEPKTGNGWSMPMCLT
jgi:hypothetical protein